jgi:hypothetical protein
MCPGRTQRAWRRGWDSNSLSPLNPRNLLILHSAGVATTAKFARVGYSLGTVCTVLVLLLLAGVASPQEQPRTFRVPFHTVNGMVLLDAMVNGKPAVLLLDTGANLSIVDYRSAGFPALKLDVLLPTGKTGAEGNCVSREVSKISLGLRSWLSRRTCLMDLSDASKRMGARIDGFVGQDLLQEFSAVRIDYKNHAVELESKK